MAIGPFTQSGAPVPAATGQAVSQVLGVEGPDIDNLQAAVFVIKPPGITQRYNLPAGETVLTLPILRTGILTSSNPGSTVVTLPRLNVDVVNGGTTYPKLNFTRPSNGSAELYFYLQRNGAGVLFCNGVPGVDIKWNDLDIQYQAQYGAAVMLVFCGFDATTGNDVWSAQ